MNEWRNNADYAGAYFCEYEVFKNIYQVLARTAPRTGQSIFLALFTLTEERPEPPDSGMDCLFQAIHDATRRCDVFARFSAVQYIVLFTADAIQNCETAARRIADAYIQSCGAPPPIHTIWSLDEL